MAKILKSQVVNDTIVLDYASGDYAKYLKDKAEYEKELAAFYDTNTLEGIENVELQKDPPSAPEIKNALNGLRIMDVNVRQPYKLTRSPIETGMYISDCKVRQPITISIKGICDNMRGPLLTAREDKSLKDTRSNFDSGIPLIGGAINNVVNGVVDTVMGYEFETEQQIETRARSVYKKIHQMLNDKTRVNNAPRTWIISTKGAVYQNMILKDVEQLNDWEHLMVIPVTLHFEELMMVGQDNNDDVFLSDDDSPLKMGGSMKKGNLAERTWDGIKSIVS